ncbi:TetR/AcrR family transcriptional regulator [Microbacterium sp. SORGH_AS_0888]|uniref:TetR/AcrR family transcriptional regulator n=1 Tax=Microbacterium sp. SORGH_AS_0888 TaxID=3041791 RepID=UPI002784A4D3|nr:TetR/AcrR family transcriptional regulator [Microbacterium sp. SORGH_AS_0888]MDQ1129862.1 TetR/AcrR family transcriptional repressor of nem operon [Microbacterium sp. SORGH_AS_0888]
MGRSRSFVETEAVRAARGVFWDRGYAETAVPELERATGLGRSSLYHGFGSKRGLFDAAVTSYLDEVVRPRLAPLQTTSVAPGALATYLTGLRAAMADGTTQLATHGCLLMNAATTSTVDDDALRQVVRSYRAELATAFAAGVDAARPELGDDARAQLATSCTAHVVAAMSIVRADPAAAVEFLDSALRLVRA